jgi:exonuclease III
VVTMKVISYNVRGLGGVEKRAEVRRLVQEKNPFVLCIQESKLTFVKEIWGDAPFGYSFQPSVGASGGMITVWNNSLIDVWSSTSFDHVLVITGRVILTGEDIVIINVYAPCDMLAKRSLWERLTSFINSKTELCLCLCGDFNSICGMEERKGRG